MQRSKRLGGHSDGFSYFVRSASSGLSLSRCSGTATGAGSDPGERRLVSGMGSTVQVFSSLWKGGLGGVVASASLSPGIGIPTLHEQLNSERGDRERD